MTTNQSLDEIQIELENNIRFEERVLFNEIQNTATSEQIESVKHIHLDDKFADNRSDVFWE